LCVSQTEQQDKSQHTPKERANFALPQALNINMANEALVQTDCARVVGVNAAHEPWEI